MNDHGWDFLPIKDGHNVVKKKHELIIICHFHAMWGKTRIEIPIFHSRKHKWTGLLKNAGPFVLSRMRWMVDQRKIPSNTAAVNLRCVSLPVISHFVETTTTENTMNINISPHSVGPGSLASLWKQRPPMHMFACWNKACCVGGIESKDFGPWVESHFLASLTEV